MNPDAPDSVLSRFRAEVSRSLTEQLSALRGEVRELTAVVATSAAAKAAAATALATSPGKGVVYEQVVLGLLEGCALAHGDLAAAVGTEPGSVGTKKGDVVITVNPYDTGGAPVAVVVEVKDRKLSMAKTTAELTAAMTNWDAPVGIAVFSSQDLHRRRCRSPGSTRRRFSSWTATTPTRPRCGWHTRGPGGSPAGSSCTTATVSTSAGSRRCSRPPAVAWPAGQRSGGHTRRPGPGIEQAGDELDCLVDEVTAALHELERLLTVSPLPDAATS